MPQPKYLYTLRGVSVPENHTSTCFWCPCPWISGRNGWTSLSKKTRKKTWKKHPNRSKKSNFRHEFLQDLSFQICFSCFGIFPWWIQSIHPQNLGWNPKIPCWKRGNIYKPTVFGFHVCFWGCKPAGFWGFHLHIFPTQLEGHTAISLDLRASASRSASEELPSAPKNLSLCGSHLNHLKSRVKKSWRKIPTKKHRCLEAFSLLPTMDVLKYFHCQFAISGLSIPAARKLWCLQCSHPLSHRVHLLRHCRPTCQAYIFGIWIWQDAGSSVTIRMTCPFFY